MVVVDLLRAVLADLHEEGVELRDDDIIVVTIFFFANRHEFSWVEGSFTAWYIAFMVWSLILLVVRVYIAGFVHKFFNALQSVGDDRAKELGEHSNYDQKCVVVP